MSQKCALAQEIRLGSPDRFSSGEGGVWARGPSRRGSAYEISKSSGFRWISGFQFGFLDFSLDFWISGFQSGFLDFKVDFWISKWISGFQSGFLDFKWISGFQSGFLDFKADFWISLFLKIQLMNNHEPHSSQPIC